MKITVCLCTHTFDNCLFRRYVLDRVLFHLSLQISSGKIPDVTPVLEKGSLQLIRRLLEHRISEARFEEYFQGTSAPVADSLEIHLFITNLANK